MSEDSPIKLFAPKAQETREFIGKPAAYRQFAEMLEAKKPQIAAGTRLNSPQIRGR